MHKYRKVFIQELSENREPRLSIRTAMYCIKRWGQLGIERRKDDESSEAESDNETSEFALDSDDDDNNMFEGGRAGKLIIALPDITELWFYSRGVARGQPETRKKWWQIILYCVKLLRVLEVAVRTMLLKGIGLHRHWPQRCQLQFYPMYS